MQLFYRFVQGNAHDCAWSLLADALHKCGHSLSDYTLCRSALGKPYFAEAGAPHFSLSHTRELAVCAIGDTPIGVDAERCDRRISPALCNRFLSACAAKDAILRWTERESFGKLTGEGVAVQVTPFAADTLCYHTYTVAEHIVTVCYRKTDPPSPPQEL